MMFSYDEMNPLTEKRQLLRVKSSTERILCNKIPITVREKKEEKTVKSYKNDCKIIKQIIESITQSAQLKDEQKEMLLSLEKIVNNIIIEKEKETKKNKQFNSLKIEPLFNSINYLSSPTTKDSIINSIQKQIISLKKTLIKKEKEIKHLEKKNHELVLKLSEEAIKSSVLKEIAEEEQKKLRKNREKYKIIISEIQNRNNTINQMRLTSCKSYSIDKPSINLSYLPNTINDQLMLTEQKCKNSKKIYLLKNKSIQSNLVTKLSKKEQKHNLYEKRKNSFDIITMDNIRLIVNNDYSNTIERKPLFTQSQF